MHCENIKELLYEFLTNRLGKKEDYQKVNEHLTICKECQKDLEELKGTLSLLNGWKAPEVPAGFKARVMEAIEEKAARRRVTLFDWIKERVLRPYYFKFPLGALAVAAMVLLALTIYRGFIPELDRTPRNFEITTKVIEAKNPIIVETKNVKKTFNQLKEMIQTYQGTLIRRRLIDGEVEVTFKVEQEREEVFFKDIGQLGNVKKMKEGFKDGDGNFVIVLRGG